MSDQRFTERARTQMEGQPLKHSPDDFGATSTTSLRVVSDNRISKSLPSTGRVSPREDSTRISFKKGEELKSSDKKAMLNPSKSKGDEKSGDEKVELLEPNKYPVKRGEEEIMVIKKTIQLVQKKDPTLLKRYRSDDHKISRVVMREVRPKNGYNVTKAARFYHETVAWRESNYLEHILRYPPGKLPVFNMLLPEFSYNCFDKEGHPVLFIKFGLSSGKQVLNRISVHEWAMCHAVQLDLMELMCRQQTKNLGKWIDKMRVVIDFEGVSIFAIRDLISYAKRCAYMDTTYYTGLMLSTHLINVPQSLSWATALFWPFMSAGVKRKIKLFTTGFEKELLKIIPAQSLPKRYGGKREWDPEDPSKIDWKKYDLERKTVCRKTLKLQKIFLKSNAVHVVSMKCKAGTQVEYYFETDMTSLVFECKLINDSKEKKNKPHMLIESASRKCHQVCENSHVNVFEDCTLSFRWKNENGWSTRKQTLTYGFKKRSIQIPQVDGALGHLRLMQ
mmetsp:Transcript_5459/g.8070  ORF Transcript_5459/g.8070 Transcript_5459/m.8070 type:complete len:504 (-) Transcript_5459:151-1662(-)|eukprot:CAMPEP_0167754856 /NCGR_PEP_ID=MMETSP0110_2-20121227/8502_1 /TAXON_ID=629695 /ORGANISM="Gymnochlora sp., Strain CCMP2014" /LENGTH=503 /DNA_ID=CAMNT_0007640781 /DNA_START=134 /DNA_END=1645 /DNA_ORIENTATION=-